MELEDGWFWKMRGVSTFETLFFETLWPRAVGQKTGQNGGSIYDRNAFRCTEIWKVLGLVVMSQRPRFKNMSLCNCELFCDSSYVFTYLFICI